MATNDSTLLSIASAGPAETYGDVLSRLRAIEAELDPSDGLIWFNRLYTAMTAAVVEAARRHRFDDPVFTERLDCQFANLYFVALAAHLSDPGSGPGSWEPLFRARPRTDILPLQFAIAGVNAHINRDLPVALVTTFLELAREPVRGGEAHADYQKINAILEVTMDESKAWLLTGGLALGDAVLGPVDDLLEMWSLKRAREAAWVASEVRWAIRAIPSISRHHLEALDRMVGLAGRGLLRPMHHAGVLERPSSSLTGR
jgi:Family of unknown function (DUF5995)